MTDFAEGQHPEQGVVQVFMHVNNPTRVQHFTFSTPMIFGELF